MHYSQQRHYLLPVDVGSSRGLRYMPARILRFETTAARSSPDRHNARYLSATLAAIVDDLQAIEHASPHVLIPIGRIARQFARGLRGPSAEHAGSNNK